MWAPSKRMCGVNSHHRLNTHQHPLMQLKNCPMTRSLPLRLQNLRKLTRTCCLISFNLEVSGFKELTPNRLALASVLGPFAVHLLKLILHTPVHWCIIRGYNFISKFSPESRGYSRFQSTSPSVESPVYIFRPLGNWYPNLPIFIVWLRSLKTPETPGVSITFGTLSACRSFETKYYWTFSHCFYRISFCSRVYMYVRNAFNVTAKANYSWEKRIAHSKTNQPRTRYFYSRGQFVL